MNGIRNSPECPRREVSVLESVVNVLFPPRCMACRQLTPYVIDRHRPLCDGCREEVVTLCEPVCPRCGHPTEQQVETYCGQCPPFKVYYRRARAAVAYEGPMRELIGGFKFGFRDYLQEYLGRWLVQGWEEFLKQEQFDAIVPVPLHWMRKWWREFNQAQLLSEVLAGYTGLPLEPDMLRRHRRTRRQTATAGPERLRNVRGAFSLTGRRDPTGQRLLLVDDVHTTGATANECARVLQAAGAVEVTVLTLARVVDEQGGCVQGRAVLP